MLDNIAILATYIMLIQGTCKRNGRSKWALNRVLEREWWMDGVHSSQNRIITPTVASSFCSMWRASSRYYDVHLKFLSKVEFLKILFLFIVLGPTANFSSQHGPEWLVFTEDSEEEKKANQTAHSQASQTAKSVIFFRSYTSYCLFLSQKLLQPFLQDYFNGRKLN